MGLLLLGWVVTIIEPQWWLAQYVGYGVLATALPLYAVVAVVAARRFRWRAWLLPLVLFTALLVVSVPLATYNRGYAFEFTKRFVLFLILAGATATYADTARRAMAVALLFGIGQFLWFGVQGVVDGSVRWHPHLANYDGYGPLTVFGTGLAYYFGLAAQDRRVRLLGLAAAALCVLGVVASFARGAVVSLVFVTALIWLRSPRKLLTTGALVTGIGLVLVVTTFFLADEKRGGNDDSPVGFWAEMATLTSDAGGSRSDRADLWKGAWIVYTVHPVIGAGPANFGPAANTLLRSGELGGNYTDPTTIYDRALHTSYFQILAELGTIGALLFLYLLFDFFRRNAAMRHPRAVLAWRAATHGRFDLRMLSLGLEAGMVGFLAPAFFYNQLNEPWLYSLLIVNGLLHDLAMRAAQAAPAPPRAR